MKKRFLTTFLSPALLLGASAAHAVEYSAPGDPPKIRVFDAITDTLVCHSFVNRCELQPGAYAVKIYDSLSGPASSILQINLASEVIGAAPDADTLGALECADGEVAKFIDSAWACAADNDTTPDAVDVLTILEGYFCTDGEMLLRDSDTNAIACTSEYTCPFQPIAGSTYELSEIWIDEPGWCAINYTLIEEPAITDGSVVYYTSVQLQVDEDAYYADWLGPVRESLDYEPLADRNIARACAIDAGCRRF